MSAGSEAAAGIAAWTPPGAPAKREIFSWAFFDFANSSFVTVMATVLFPVYFAAHLCGGSPEADRWWGWAFGAANLLVVLLSPFLGAMADRAGAKKKFLACTTATCVGATLALAFVPAGQVMPAAALFVVANAAFLLGENFIAGFLPEISTPATAGRISGYGWAIGYFGGLSSLLLAKALAAPWWIVATALFFALASAPTFLFLRERKRPEPLAAGESWWSLAWGPIKATVRDVAAHRALAIFFASYFFGMCGLTVVVAFAGIFSTKGLGMNQTQLATMFIFLQISAAAGAFGFGWIQDRIGSRRALDMALALWVCVTAACYFTESIAVFQGVAVFAGVAIGAFQSCARARVSQLTPTEKAGQFFGFWGVFGKLAGFVGPVVFGEMSVRFDIRIALLGTLAFFVASLAILQADRSG